MAKECCIRCVNTGIFSRHRYCDNFDCPCHTPEPVANDAHAIGQSIKQQMNRENDVADKAGYFEEGFGKLEPKLEFEDKPLNWETEFEERFGGITANDAGKYWLSHYEHLRLFISKAIEQAREDVAQEMFGQEAEEVQKAYEKGERAATKAAITMVESQKKLGNVKHGPCCVCQTCHFLFDDCECERNRILDEVATLLKESLTK